MVVKPFILKTLNGVSGCSGNATVACLFVRSLIDYFTNIAVCCIFTIIIALTTAQ